MECVIENCGNEMHNQMRGYCRSHYNKFRRYGVPEIVKDCEECGKKFTANMNFQKFCSVICYRRARMKKPIEKMKAKIRHKAYKQTEKGKASSIKSTLIQREKNYEKYLARANVRNHISAGKIIKPTICSMCNEVNKLDAHHHKGYSKEHRLDVIWLCRTCHVQEEKRLKYQENL